MGILMKLPWKNHDFSHSCRYLCIRNCMRFSGGSKMRNPNTAPFTIPPKIGSHLMTPKIPPDHWLLTLLATLLSNNRPRQVGWLRTALAWKCLDEVERLIVAPSSNSRLHHQQKKVHSFRKSESPSKSKNPSLFFSDSENPSNTNHQ